MLDKPKEILATIKSMSINKTINNLWHTVLNTYMIVLNIGKAIRSKFFTFI